MSIEKTTDYDRSRRTEIRHEFLGASADNPFIANVSSPRGVMHSSHFAGHLALLNPDPRMLLSGIEYEFGKTINDVRVENDCVVKGVLPMYQGTGMESPVTLVFVEFMRNDQLFLDYIQVPSYKSQHNYFGYELKQTEIMADLSYNAPLSKGDILAKTNSYGREGEYMPGLNAQTIFMSHPSVAEDGVVISQSLARRAASESYLKRVINITRNTIPLNINGRDGAYRFLPDIGEKVREDGLLCAIRERNDWFSVSDMSDVNLSEEDPTFDSLTYVNPYSEVVSITVLKGNNGKSEFSPHITAQLDHYAGMLISHYQQVLRIYETILAEKKSLYGSVAGVRMTPRMSRFVTDCATKVEMSVNPRNKMSYRKVLIDQYRIEIITKSLVIPNLGHKLSDYHASKAVVCAILPDDHMPVDEMGNRADIITDNTSTISRMTLGRAYELDVGAACRDNRQRLLDYLTIHYGPDFLNTMPADGYRYAHQFLLDFHSLFNSDIPTWLNSLNDEEFREYLRTIKDEMLRVYYPPDNERNIVDVLDDLEKSPFAPHLGHVSYVDPRGVRVTTVDKIRIGVVSLIFLEKIGSTFSAVSSSRVNNFGFPVKGTNHDKPRYPHSQTPGKFLGETEGRIALSYMGRSATAEMMDLALNPIAHKAVYLNALESDIPFNQHYQIDRKAIPHGQGKGIMFLKHIFTAAGADFVYKEREGS